MRTQRSKPPPSARKGYVATALMIAGLLLMMAAAVWIAAQPRAPTVGSRTGWDCQQVPGGEEICSRDPGPVLRH